MFQHPLVDLYYKYQTHINDAFVIWGIMFLMYWTDKFLYAADINLPTVPLALSGALYMGTRYVVRKKKIQKKFGGFANYGPLYCLTLAFMTFIIYYFQIRLSHFPRVLLFGMWL